MNEWLIGFVIAFVIALGFGIVIGATIMFSSMERDAIEHNCAYYHPTTGEFTWKEYK